MTLRGLRTTHEGQRQQLVDRQYAEAARYGRCTDFLCGMRAEGCYDLAEPCCKHCHHEPPASQEVGTVTRMLDLGVDAQERTDFLQEGR